MSSYNPSNSQRVFSRGSSLPPLPMKKPNPARLEKKVMHSLERPPNSSHTISELDSTPPKQTAKYISRTGGKGLGSHGPGSSKNLEKRHQSKKSYMPTVSPSPSPPRATSNIFDELLEDHPHMKSGLTYQQKEAEKRKRDRELGRKKTLSFPVEIPDIPERKPKTKLPGLSGPDTGERRVRKGVANPKKKINETLVPDFDATVGTGRSPLPKPKSAFTFEPDFGSPEKTARPKSKKQKPNKDGDITALLPVRAEPDSDDDLFNTEGEATMAAKRKLEELNAKAKATKEILDDDDKETLSASYKASRRIGKTNKLTTDSDDFFNMMKHTSVWKPDSQKLHPDDDEDDVLDLDVSLDIGSKRNTELVDEYANEQRQIKLTKEKYKNQEYPGGLSPQEIGVKFNDVCSIIPKILKGEVGSVYYERAKELRDSSSSTILSNHDMMRIGHRFTIGFYGIKRQSYIATLIKKKYNDEIDAAAAVNRTVQFWSKDSFTLYVLAPEIAIKMTLDEDLDDLGLEDVDDDQIETEVAELFDRTYDYGKFITDKIPFV